jgi:hypothetical protein
MPRSALDVSQISWRTCVAHLPTAGHSTTARVAELSRI